MATCTLGLALAPGLAWAQEPEADGVLGPPYYLGALVLAAIVALVHLLAPQLRRLLRPHSSAVTSFGGGMAAAYVFLHLLPELDEGHRLLGAMVFFLPLVGFLVNYLVRHRLHRMSAEPGRHGSASFRVELANLTVYNLLLVYVAPHLEIELGWASVAVLAALILHLMQADYALGREHQADFDRVGRYVLAAAAVSAYALLAVRQRLNETVADMLTAFLAGSVLFKVFRDEVPDTGESRIGWFIAGVVVFGVLAALELG